LYYNAYDDTDNPGTLFKWLTGSSEIDTSTDGTPITADFFAETYPMSLDWINVEGVGWKRPRGYYVEYGASEPLPNVYVNGWFDADKRIITRHISSDDV
jgi:hypothetical protein